MSDSSYEELRRGEDEMARARCHGCDEECFADELTEAYEGLEYLCTECFDEYLAESGKFDDGVNDSENLSERTHRIKADEAYILLWRSGGTLNFKWHQTMVVKNWTIAMAQVHEVSRMGYFNFLATYDEFKVHGLPKTYEANVYFQNKKN